MKKIIVKNKTKLNINKSYIAEPIEVKIEKMITKQEPIEASMAYAAMERKDGVLPEYDIRTNRFEIGHETMAKASKAHDKGRDFRRNGAGEQAKKDEKGSASDVIFTTPVTDTVS